MKTLLCAVGLVLLAGCGSSTDVQQERRIVELEQRLEHLEQLVKAHDNNLESIMLSREHRSAAGY